MFNDALKKVRAFIKLADNNKDGELEILPDDVFLVSYPKSGNTWGRFMLSYCLFENLKEGDVDFGTIEDYVPDLHVANPRKNLQSPRVMKTHSTYSQKYKRVIYMVRDGRDAIVSYYYHMTQREEFSGSFSDFIRADIPFGKWADHVKGWIEPHPSQNILLVKYEKLKANPVETLKIMIEFIGKKVDEERLKKAVNWSSFQNMKKIEKEKGLPNHPRAKKQDFVRKGVVGGWRDEFNENDIQYFLNDGAGEVLKRMGYIK